MEGESVIRFEAKKTWMRGSSFMSFVDLLLHNMGNFQLRQMIQVNKVSLYLD